MAQQPGWGRGESWRREFHLRLPRGSGAQVHGPHLLLAQAVSGERDGEGKQAGLECDLLMLGAVVKPLCHNPALSLLS